MKFNREVQSKEGRTGLNRVLFNRLTPDHWPRWLAYVFAVELVLVTLLFRLTIGETFFERPLLILFVLPILLSACLGGLGGIIGIVEDVTARKAAGLALQESEERFRQTNPPRPSPSAVMAASW
jgi:PAS domain-containing protein